MIAVATTERTVRVPDDIAREIRAALGNELLTLWEMANEDLAPFDLDQDFANAERTYLPMLARHLEALQAVGVSEPNAPISTEIPVKEARRLGKRALMDAICRLEEEAAKVGEQEEPVVDRLLELSRLVFALNTFVIRVASEVDDAA